MVWVSKGNILLYQVEVPSKGEYKFHLLPGNYDLVATNSIGCFDEISLNVRGKKTANLSPSKAKPTKERKPASGGLSYGSPHCVTCGPAYGGYSMPYFGAQKSGSPFLLCAPHRCTCPNSGAHRSNPDRPPFAGREPRSGCGRSLNARLRTHHLAHTGDTPRRKAGLHHPS